MSKLRVYMVAKQLGMDNKSLVALFQSLGVDEVRNHMSAVSADQVERAKRHLSRGDDKVVEEQVRSAGGGAGVIIRRGRKKPEATSEVPPSTEKPIRRGAGAARSTADSPASRGAPVAQRGPTLVTEAAAAGTRAPEPAAVSPMAGAQPDVSPGAAGASAPASEARAATPPVRREARGTPARTAVAPTPQAAAPAEPTPSSAAPSEQVSVETRAATPAPSPGESAAAPPASATAATGTTGEPITAAAAPPAMTAGESPTLGGTDAAPATAAVQPPAAIDDPGPAPTASPAPAVAATSPAAEEPAPSAPAPREPQPAVAARPQARQAPSAPARRPAGAVSGVRAETGKPSTPAAAVSRPAPKTGIDVWEGRPGVPMPQPPRTSGMPRRVQYDAKMGGGQRRGPVATGGRMRGGRRGIGSMGSRRPGSGAVTTQERAAHKKVVRIEQDISLQALAAKMGVKAGEVLMKLMSLGVSGVNINSSLDSDTAKIVGEEFGWTIEDVAVSEDEAIAMAQGGGEAEPVDEEREPRPPVVTVMGHVDHGKTSLLDRVRKATVAQGEAGGITQHIGAYSVKTKKGRITFLDTPGHAAFTQMRARGAKCTDIVVLVVAADDGVMPQTREAISHAKDARCPIVVAVNKIDKPDSQPERVRRELSEVGLVPEEWGGDTLFCEVSAHTGDGVDELLDAVLLQAEVLDLRANPKRHARGTVIEAKLDRGQGPVATVLVMEGTLRKGDGLLVGNSWGKVRAMLDENGRNVPAAGPSMPVAVIGLNEVPSAGDMVDAVQDAKKAQQIAEQRRDKIAEKSRVSTAKISLEELARRMSQSDQKDLKLILKGDVQGSVEALSEALTKMSTDKVRVTVVHAGVGAVTEGDVNLAVAARAIIIGFNVRPAGKAASLAQKEGIEIRQYSVIYDATDDVRATMEGLLAPSLVEEAIGEAEVRKIFKVTKAGVVAGCMVTNGVVRRNSFVRLRRGKDVIWEGKLDSLKRFKDDAKEVREGFDCGISFNGFSDLQEGDIIAAFEMKEVRPTL